MKFVFSYLKPYTKRMTWGLVIKFGGTITDLLLPLLLGHIIDVVVKQNSIPRILLWGLLMLACAVLCVVFNIIANRMAARVARDTTRRIRRDVFEKTTKLSCLQVDKLTIPSLEARLTSDTYNLHQMLGQVQRMGVRAPILLVGGILITLFIEPVLTLILVAMLPIASVLVYRISKKGIPLYTQTQRAVDRMVRTVRENITGIRIIKALSKTDYEIKRFDKTNLDLSEREQKAGTTMAVTNPAMGLLLNCGMTFVIFLGAYRVNSGATQPGTIVAFLSYFTIILSAMQAITRIFIVYSKASASAKRLAEVMDMPVDLPVTQLSFWNAQPDPAHITFDDVSFSFPSHKNTLQHISFSLGKGETLGIIGATGSGKSTLIHLLMRLYDVTSGEIRISGRPIRSIPEGELHSMFGVTFQNDALFADSIAENIDLGRGIPPEQIAHAAYLAQAKQFIDGLDDGLAHALTSRGTNVSGGQKQRILIARALAAQPDILILDDSSSALDYRTDALLRRAISLEFQRTTSIIIAQRVSSLMHADQILVLEEGSVIGQGRHEELLESCEVYREIYASQMGGGDVA